MILQKPIINLLLASILFILPFTPLQISYTAWFFLIPLLFLLKECKNASQAFRVGFVFGFIINLVGLYWFYYVAYFWVLFIVVVYALLMGLLLMLAWLFVFKQVSVLKFLSWKASFWIPFLFVALEYFRSEVPLFGFGWLQVGATQVSNLPVLQFASLLGVYGLSWLVCLVNVGFFIAAVLCLKKEKRLAGVGIFLLTLVLLVLVHYFGSNRYESLREKKGPVLRIGVAQTNIPQAIKWDPSFRKFHLEKTQKILEKMQFEDPDLVLLPEATYPGSLNLEFEESFLTGAESPVHVPLLIGAPYLIPGKAIYNAAYFVRDQKIESTYKKLVLVPFGEFIPFEPFFRFLGLSEYADAMGVGRFSAGSEKTLFQIGPTQHRFAALICFEDTMPKIARNFLREGAHFLVNITNDAWFLDSWEPYQHLQASILRAVENGCYVIRSANTGISAFIAPTGQVLDQVQDEKGKVVFVQGSLVKPVFLHQVETFYSQKGYFFPNLSLLLLAFGLLVQCGKFCRHFFQK